MKLSKKTLPTIATVVLAAAVAGTLAWEVIERLAGAAGLAMDLSVGPVSVDFHVVSFSLRANPGTLLGLAAGALLARAV
jgi:hypothetical protein